MNKLTDSEIVKALNICINEDYCKNCPLDGKAFSEGCINYLRQQCFDLINRQKAEIEELRKGFTADADFFASEYDTKIKAEAIKEFAEKLKCRSHRFKTIDRIFVDCIPLDYIEKLVKEMTEQTTFEKVEHNSLCETETYKGGE